MTQLRAPERLPVRPTAAVRPVELPRIPRIGRAAGAETAPKQAPLPVGAQLYIGMVFSGWLVVGALTWRTLSARDVLTLLPVVLLTTLVQQLGLGLYAKSTSVTLGAVGNLAAGMLYGPAGALLTGSIGIIINSAARRTMRACLFNLGSIGLSNGLAALAFVACGRFVPGSGPVAQVPGALAAGVVAYLSETSFVTVIVSLTQGRTLRAVWGENFRWLLPHWLGLGLVALGLAVTYRATGLVGLLAFAGPALLMRYAMKQYLERTTRSVHELSARNAELESANREIEEMTGTLRDTFAGTLEALVAALDARDRETYGHSARVAELTKVLGRAMGIPEDTPEWIDIERGALLHDVGKIGVSDMILRKPGALTDAEWADMRRHAQIGHDMLKDIPFLAGAARIVAAHHERWDGKGYPRGLAEEEIPLGARMFMAADTFDAMATDRPYRRARAYPEILAELERCAGTQFDPEVIAKVREVFPEWVRLHRRSLERAGVARLSEVA